MSVLTQALISDLNAARSQISEVMGESTVFELRLRIIAQLEPKVQEELKKILKSKKKTNKPFYKGDLEDLIDAVLEVFRDNLEQVEQDAISACRIPRNKLAHGSLVEFMCGMHSTGESYSRKMDPNTGKRGVLSRDDLVEGLKCILNPTKSRALHEFCIMIRIAINILDQKVLGSISSWM